jgi:hypothetical protein
MSALIERQHMKIFDECRRDKVPPMRMRGTAMQKQERPFALASIVDTIQREPIGDEAMRLHFFTGLSQYSSSSRSNLPRTYDIFESRPFHATI